MKISSAQAEKVLKGNKTFTQFAFSMLITRLKSQYASDPSPKTLNTCTDEINAFLSKFQKLMTADYAVISAM